MTPRLLDKYGQPVQRQVLTQEVAAPSLRGVRQIYSGHPAQGLTPRRLGALLRAAEEGDPTAQCELAEDMEEKDGHYASVISTRKRAVAQLDITIEAASDSTEDEAAAQLVRDFVTDRDELESELIDILDAIGKGYSFVEIIWDTSQQQWWPKRLEYRLPAWFEFDRNDGATPLLRTESGAQPLDPFKYIYHTSKAKSGLVVRGGLARLCAWGYLFKNFSLKDWAVFMETFGQPLRVGRFHATATDDEKAALLRAVVGIGSDFGAIIPEQMALEFIDSGSKTASADLYDRFARYWDSQTSKAVLGQTMTTDDGSSLAQAKVHNEVREDIERADAKQLAATLNRDLVRPLIDLNYGPQKRYPKLRIGRPEAEDLDALVSRVEKLVPLGLRVGQRQISNKLGLAAPDADDQLLASSARLTVAAPAPTARSQALAKSEVAVAPSAAAPTLGHRSVADRLASLADPTVKAWIGELSEIVGAASSYDELQQALLEFAAEQPEENLVALIAGGLTLAELTGRADLIDTDPEAEGEQDA